MCALCMNVGTPWRGPLESLAEAQGDLGTTSHRAQLPGLPFFRRPRTGILSDKDESEKPA